jgi:soluble lytic murein transglycosylase-like protein
MNNISTMDAYYYDGKTFRPRCRTLEYLRYLLIIALFSAGLLYADPPAEASFNQPPNPAIVSETKVYWQYFDWIKAHSKLSEVDASVLARSVIKYSEAYGFKKNLILALVKVESGFNPYAISSVGAVGITQVMLQYHKEKVDDILNENGNFNPFDIETNLRMGMMVLHEFNGDMQRYNGEHQNMIYTSLVMDAKKGIDQELPEV